MTSLAVWLLPGPLLLLVSSLAVAQPRLFGTVTNLRGELSTGVWEIGIEGTGAGPAKRRAVVPGGVASGPIMTAGGQFVVWDSYRADSSRSLVIFDPRTGEVRLLPFAGALGVSDPTRLSLLLEGEQGLVRLVPERSRLLPGTNGLRAVGISSDGARVYATRTDPVTDSPSYLEAVDAWTGRSLASIPIGTGVQKVIVTSDEKSAWVLHNQFRPPLFRALRQFLLPTGLERLTVPLPISFPSEQILAFLIDVDASRQRVFAGLGFPVSFPRNVYWDGELWTADTTDGHLLPPVAIEARSSGAVEGGSGTVFLYSDRFSSEGCGLPHLRAVAASTAKVRWEAELDIPGCLQTAFALPPLPPALGPAIANNHQVTLSWSQSPELVTGFTIEAGAAPGRSDIAILPFGPRRSITLSAVAPGTYFVRLRAWNYTGGSVPSNEIVVQVPGAGGPALKAAQITRAAARRERGVRWRG